MTLSFPKLQTIELQIIPVAVAEISTKQELAVVQWLDVLFNGNQCIFAQTIQSLTINTFLEK